MCRRISARRSQRDSSAESGRAALRGRARARPPRSRRPWTQARTAPQPRVARSRLLVRAGTIEEQAPRQYVSNPALIIARTPRQLPPDQCSARVTSPGPVTQRDRSNRGGKAKPQPTSSAPPRQLPDPRGSECDNRARQNHHGPERTHCASDLAVAYCSAASQPPASRECRRPIGVTG